MRRAVALLVALGLAAGLAAGCGPEGQPCPSAGSIKAQDGKVYHCTQTDHGLVWQ